MGNGLMNRDLTLRMTVSYVGTPFSGWQIQPNGDTVQERLETALAQLLRGRTPVTGAGRTDAGVHARGQVAHFRAPRAQVVEDLHRALNTMLPKEIRIEKLSRARPGFHARNDARGKHYRYLLLAVRKASPFLAPFVARLPGGPLELAPMREAGRRLLGEHDFAAFCGAGSAVRTTRRRLTRLEIVRRGDTINFDMEGDGFLRHQIRNMVGTLVEVGQGKRTPESMVALLRTRDRRQAGVTAPAAGLCLMKVHYGRRAEGTEGRS